MERPDLFAGEVLQFVLTIGGKGMDTNQPKQRPIDRWIKVASILARLAHIVVIVVSGID